MSEQTVMVGGVEFRITTDHAASSYGQPVVVCPDGAALGPVDMYETAEGLFSGRQIVSAARQEHRGTFIEVGTFDEAVTWLCENAPGGVVIPSDCVGEIGDEWERPGSDLDTWPMFQVAETGKVYHLAIEWHEHSPDCHGGPWLLVTPPRTEAYCALCKRRFQWAMSKVDDSEGGWLPLEWSERQVNGHFRAERERAGQRASRQLEEEMLYEEDEDDWDPDDPADKIALDVMNRSEDSDD